MKPNTPTCYSNHILIVCVYDRNEDRLNGYSGKHMGERRGRRGTKEDGKVKVYPLQKRCHGKVC